ncbi:Glycosyl transferase family 2 [Maribacter dokdonensis]|uniref:Glycosyl transferase family 2 n=1 Tax=Maribacter dokdonensis TaxID=320912 RepID=A0A1H4QEL0_9FLAO|nr:glycosyltransferase family 2 protein [Maribacter dokdonensis]SEC17988.1 Glycosyl transferase family 2 [Maribacter dokdonensis]
MNKPKISIIIPTYKPENYVLSCLKSIAEQTYSLAHIEVFLILNGPRDPYYNLLQQYIKKYLTVTIQLFYSSTKGVSNARNIGLDNSKGDCIIFMDDDDILSPTYLNTMILHFKRGHLVMAKVQVFKENVHAAMNNYMTTNYIRNQKEEHKTILSIRRNMTLVTAKLYPNDIIRGTRFNNNFQHGEDSLFMAQVIVNTNKVVLADPNAIYYWRLRPNSLSRSKIPFSKDLSNICKLIIQFTKLYSAFPIKLEYLIFVFLQQLAIIKGFISRQFKK